MMATFLMEVEKCVIHTPLKKLLASSLLIMLLWRLHLRFIAVLVSSLSLRAG